MNAVSEMGTAKFLQHVLRDIATGAAMGAAYEKWTDAFARKEVVERWNDNKALLREQWGRRVTIAELIRLPTEDLRMLGFCGWDEKLTLIPLWAFNYIADGEKLVCINGGTAIKGTNDIDLDERFGCVAWGFNMESPNV